MPRKIARNVVGPQVRRLRYARQWTQEECALRLQLQGLDWDRTALAKVEARIKKVSDAELFVLARTLRTALDGLFPSAADVKAFLATEETVR